MRRSNQVITKDDLFGGSKTEVVRNFPRREIIPYKKYLKPLARSLRNNSTKSEINLCKALKGKYKEKYDFHRQKPIDNFVADFFCHELSLVIELDGYTHQFEETVIKDVKKESKLHELKLNLLRFTDDDIFENFDSIIDVINLYIEGFENGDLSWFRHEGSPLNSLSGCDYWLPSMI